MISLGMRLPAHKKSFMKTPNILENMHVKKERARKLVRQLNLK